MKFIYVILFFTLILSCSIDSEETTSGENLQLTLNNKVCDDCTNASTTLDYLNNGFTQTDEYCATVNIPYFIGHVCDDLLIDWGDNSPDQIITEPSFIPISHTYTSNGTYQIVIKVIRDGIECEFSLLRKIVVDCIPTNCLENCETILSCIINTISVVDCTITVNVPVGSQSMYTPRLSYGPVGSQTIYNEYLNDGFNIINLDINYQNTPMAYSINIDDFQDCKDHRFFSFNCD